MKPTPTVYGFIYLENHSSSLDTSDRQLLKAIAAQAAIALHNGHLYRQATTDPLTALLNRDSFKRLLHQELEEARENNHSLAVAMVDIDYFKSVNDGHGHPYGDTVLVEFAEQMQSDLRRGDLIGRYGGEEFIVCLRHVFPADARHVLNVLRSKISANRYGEKKIKLTMSAGLACFPRHASTSDLLVKHADQALYAAKNQGRNRVVLWSPELDRIGHMQHPMAGFMTGNMARDQRCLDLFFQISGLLNQRLPTRKTMKQVTELFLEVIQADLLTLFIGTDMSDQHAIISFEDSEAFLHSDELDRLELVRSALEAQKTIVSENFAPVSGVFPRFADMKRSSETDIPRAICIPLIAYEQVCGAYYLEFSGHGDTYRSADLNFLEALSRQIALSLYFYHTALQQPGNAPPPNLEESDDNTF